MADNEIKLVTKLQADGVVKGVKDANKALEKIKDSANELKVALQKAFEEGRAIRDAKLFDIKSPKDAEKRIIALVNTIEKLEQKLQNVKNTGELDGLIAKREQIQNAMKTGRFASGAPVTFEGIMRLQDELDAIQKKIDEIGKNGKPPEVIKAMEDDLINLQRELASTIDIRNDLLQEQAESDQFASMQQGLEAIAQQERENASLAEQTAQAERDATMAFEEMSRVAWEANNPNQTALLSSIEELKSKLLTIASAVANPKDAVAWAFDEMKHKVVETLAGIGNKFLTAFNHPAETAKKALNGLGAVAHKALGGIRGALSKVAGAFKNATRHNKGFGKSLKVSFMTVLKYAFGIRSLYFLFRKLRKAITEGFGYLAQYSPEVNSALSQLKSSLTQCKNALSTAFAPILTTVAPILTTLINLVTRAITALAMFFGALTGKKVVVTASKVQEDYASGLSDSASNAGKAKDAQEELNEEYEAGIDDLHKMDDPNKDKAKAGGGAGGGLSPFDMFEETPIDPAIAQFVEKLKKAWANADFTGIGAIIGTKLKNQLDSIPWSEIQESASKVGKSIATLINGFVEVDGLGTSIGTNIAQALNTGLRVVTSLVDNTHFDSIGKFIGNGINGAFLNFNFSELGSTGAKAINGIFETIRNSVETVEWYEIAQSIMSAIISFLDEVDLSEWTSTFSEAWIGVYEFLEGAIDSVNWEELPQNVIDKIAEGFSGVDINGIATAGLNLYISILKAIGGLIVGLGGLVKTYIIDPLMEQIKLAIGEENFEWIAGMFERMITIIQTVLGVLSVVWSVAWEGIKGVVSVVWNFIGMIISTAITLIRTYIVTTLNVIRTMWTTVWTAMQGTIKTVWSLIKGTVESVFELVKTIIKNVLGIIKAIWNGDWDAVKQHLVNIWNAMKTFVSNMLDTLKTTLSTALNTLKSTWETAWNGIKSILEGVWNGIKGITNSIIGGVEKMANGVIDAVNGMINALNSIRFNVPKWVPLIGGNSFSLNIPNIGNISIPRLATGAVIPQNKEFLAVLGDQKHGKNLEAPESLIRQIVREESGGKGTYEFVAQLNRKTIFDEVIKEGQLRRDATGRNPFEFA